VIAAGVRIPSATVLWTAGVSGLAGCENAGDADGPRRARIRRRFHGYPRGAPCLCSGRRSHDNPGWSPRARSGAGSHSTGRICRACHCQRVRGRKDGRPFRYRNKGNMAVVGKNFAILESGHLRSSGFVTWLVWAALHVLALPQLQNRFRVLTQWFWSYMSGQRSSRLISEGPRSSAS